MTFWLMAALLGALAIGFVVAPLLQARTQTPAGPRRARSNTEVLRDRLAELDTDRAAERITPDEYAALRNELERSFLEDLDERTEARRGGGRWALVAVALVLPVAAVSLYADWGASWGALSELDLAADARALEQTGTGDGGPGTQQLRRIAERLAARVEREPDDADGWALLGRTRLRLGRYEGAAEAFAKVNTLTESGPIEPLIFRAQALYLAAGRRVSPRVQSAIDQVLARQPDNGLMLELMAMEAFREGDYEASAERLSRVLAQGVSGTQRRRFLRDGLARARELAGMPSTEAPAAGGSPGGGDAALTVELTATQTARSRYNGDTTLFVFARRAAGGRMPLAVRKLRLADLPTTIELTAADAMTPSRTLAIAEQVTVVARLSRDGSVARGPDDMQITSPSVSPGQHARVTLQLAGQAAADGSPRAAARGEGRNAAEGGKGRDDAEADASVRVLVEVEGELAVPDGTVYVFARSAQGGRMPLAVTRLNVHALPALVTLDESMAMTPNRSLADAERVEIIARISRSGLAEPTAGDVQGRAGPLDPAEPGGVVKLMINRRLEPTAGAR